MLNKVRAWFMTLRLKKLKDVDEYYEIVENLKSPSLTYLQKYPCYKNNLADTNKYLTQSFLDKEIVLEDNLSKWEFSKIAGDGDTFSKVKNLMQWLTANTYYAGMAHKLVADRTSSILNSAVGKTI